MWTDSDVINLERMWALSALPHFPWPSDDAEMVSRGSWGSVEGTQDIRGIGTLGLPDGCRGAGQGWRVPQLEPKGNMAAPWWVVSVTEGIRVEVPTKSTPWKAHTHQRSPHYQSHQHQAKAEWDPRCFPTATWGQLYKRMSKKTSATLFLLLLSEPQKF